jgi:hypothetical protein
MKESQDHLLPECFGDTMLINTLIKADCNHKPSISQVFITLKVHFKNRKAVGIIDDDKKKDDYYKEFKIIEETNYFRYLAHPNKLHFLIVLIPALEVFLIRCGNDYGVKHRLLNDSEQLKKVMKDMNVGTNGEVKGLLNDLLQKKAEPLIRIKQILVMHKV